MAQKALPAAKKIDAAKFLPGKKADTKMLASNRAKVISRDESLVLVHKKVIKVEKLIQTNFKIKSISDKKKRIQHEREKDRVQEEILEDTPKDSNLKKTESKLPVPGFAFFGEIKDAILKLFFGWLAIKMLPHLPKLLGFLPVLKQGLETVTDWMIGGLDALTGFLAEGYKMYDTAKDWITDTFGEGGKKNFEAITGHITKAFNLISIIAMGMIASAGFGGPKGKGPRRGIRNTAKRLGKNLKKFLGKTDKTVIDRAKNINKIKRAKFFNKFTDPAKKIASKAKNLGGKGINLAKKLVPKSLPSVGGMLSGLWNWGGQQTQKVGEAVGKTWGSVSKFVTDLPAKTRAMWDDVAKKITPYLDEIGKGVKSMGDSLGRRWEDLKNLNPQKAMEKMQSRMMKNVEILMKKNPVLKKVMTALNPRNAAAKMGGLIQSAQKNPALKKVLSVLKSNKAASKGLGPIDKVITALTALTDYALFKESPINAIFKGLGGLVGYGLGFAAASAVPVLGQSGIFNFAGGIAGASLGEYIAFLMLKGLAKTPLANIDDPIAANTQGMTPRKLVRNPENLADHMIDDKLIKQAQEEGIGDPVGGFGIDDKKITETPSNNQTSSTTTSTSTSASTSASSTPGGSGGGIRNAGKGSKLAGELGRFLDKEGLGNWGSGVHQHPEHPDWPKESGHRVGSLHYASQGGRAIDIGGWGPNTFRREGESGTDDQTRIMQGIARFHKKKGLPPPPGGTAEWAHEGNEPTGHWNHVHVAYGGGGLVKGLTNAMLGERGPEFVIDADSTAALRTTFPGLLEALNKADYDGTINVLRSYAEYEKGLARESDTKRQNIILNQQTTSDPVVNEKVVFVNKSDRYASCYLNR